MKFKLLLSVAISILATCTTTAQFCIPEQADEFSSKAINQINPKHLRWIKSTTTDIDSGELMLDGLNQQASAYGRLNNLQDMDIEAVVLLVMMEASKSAQEDIRAMMEQMRDANKKKQAMRDAVNLIKKKRAEQENNLRKEYAYRKQYDSLKILLMPSSIIKNRAVSVTLAEWDALLNSTWDNLDSMNEMGEMVSLRLQMIMDRRSKMMSTLSNIMKKISKTQDEIVKNLK